MKIQITPGAIRTKWCLYGLTDPMTHELLYVGTCQLKKLFDFGDVWSNGKFDPEKSYMLTIIDSAEHRHDANNKQSAYLRNLPRIPTINRYSSFADRRPEVICNESGERFKNARQCAEAHHLSYPALINHLACKKGFKSVKGRTYQYDRKGASIPEPRAFPVKPDAVATPADQPKFNG